MKKYLFAIGTMCVSSAYAQVGINTENPKATLDISAKTNDGSRPEGLIIPRLTGDQIKSADAQYTSAQAGILIYATSAVTAPVGKTVNITAAGYYFFDGSIWQRVTTGAGTNIYNADGTLSANRTVTQGTNTLAFTSTATTGTSHFTVDGNTFNVDAVNNRAGVGTAAPTHDFSVHGTTNTNMSIRRAASSTGAAQIFFEKTNSTDPTVNTAVTTNTNIGGILFHGGNGTNYNNAASAIYGTASENHTTTAAGGQLRLLTTPNGTIVSQERMRVDQNGFVGINTTVPSERLDVAGNVKFTGSLMPNNLPGSIGQVLTITGAGNSPVWNSFTASNTPNIYTTDGTVAANRTVAQGANTLAFTSTATTGTSHFTVDGSTLNVDAVNNRVGIGTAAPGNILVVSGTGGTGTGLQLPTGASSGKILTSDINGNTSWQTGSFVAYSEIHGTGNSTSYTSNEKIGCLSTTMGDNVKGIYGSSFGWDNTNKRWVAPFTGRYRITINGYFNPRADNVNPRIYAYKNGTSVAGLVSVNQPSGSSDISNSTSTIVQMNQGEWVEFRAFLSPITIWCNNYHTFIRVESIE